MAVQRFAERMLAGEPIKKVVGATARPPELPSSVFRMLIVALLSLPALDSQFGSGESFRDYVFVEDVARAFVCALFPGDKSEIAKDALVGRPQVYNVAGVVLIGNKSSRRSGSKSSSSNNSD